MNRAKAQYAMRQPRRCTITGSASLGKLNWESWYYVEPGGLDVMVRKPGAGTIAVKITKRQLQQALKLIECAHNGTA